MNKDSKYYNLIENLVKQNRRFVGNEQFLNKIVDDVLCHANTIIQTIDDENVINEFLNKAVTTSIITVSKKMNKDRQHTSGAQQLIEKINNQKQDQDINKKYIDDFINGNIERTPYSQTAQSTTEPEEKQITYEQLSEITDNNNIDIEFNDEKDIVVETDHNEPGNDEIIDSANQTALLNESLKLFDNNETEEINENIVDTNITQDIEDVNNLNEPSIEIQDEEIADGVDYDIVYQHESEDIQEQDADTLELSFNEQNNSEDTEENQTALDNDFDVENLNDMEELDDTTESIEISDSEYSDLSIDEIDSDNPLGTDDLLVETDNYKLAETEEDLLDEDSIILEADNNIYHSIYEVLNYKQNPINADKNKINIEKIIESIKSLDKDYPNLNIIDIYKLRYKELMEIDNISNTLNMDSDDVIKALNLMIDVV